MAKYAFIAATVVLTVLGQLVIKARAGEISDPAVGRFGYVVAMYTDFYVLSALACALLASVTWALAIEKASLSFAYPFMALNFVLVPVLGMAFFNEQISAGQIVGLSLIVAGVMINGLSG